MNKDMMNSRQRFIKTMNYEQTDRPPLFNEGIRDEVLKLWHRQGLGKKENLERMFTFDQREEVEPLLEPLPFPDYWPKTQRGMNKLVEHLDPNDPSRLPEDWDEKVKTWKVRDYPLILRVHRGYFLSMGVHGWRRFTEAIQLLVDSPELVSEWMNTVGKFSAQLIDKILHQVDVDAVLFSEPISGNHGPLISPRMYEKFVVNSFLPILEVLNQHRVKIIIYRTYANTRRLLPAVFEAGFNCLWACEANPEAMDYIEIRREFGKELRLIGGIDSDSLRESREEIDRSVMEVAVPLLEQGGFIPLADGRVREDVPFENYMYYRRMLEKVSKKPN